MCSSNEQELHQEGGRSPASHMYLLGGCFSEKKAPGEAEHRDRARRQEHTVILTGFFPEATAAAVRCEALLPRARFEGFPEALSQSPSDQGGGKWPV